MGLEVARFWVGMIMMYMKMGSETWCYDHRFSVNAYPLLWMKTLRARWRCDLDAENLQNRFGCH